MLALASAACRDTFRCEQKSASSGSMESSQTKAPTRPILIHEILEVVRDALGGRYIVCPLAHVAEVAGA